MKNGFFLATFSLLGVAGCAQTPAEMVYTSAMLVKYQQCADLPRPAHDQCVAALREREATGREDAANEYDRRRRLQEKQNVETSEIARAMKENDRRRSNR